MGVFMMQVIKNFSHKTANKLVTLNFNKIIPYNDFSLNN